MQAKQVDPKIEAYKDAFQALPTPLMKKKNTRRSGVASQIKREVKPNKMQRMTVQMIEMQRENNRLRD